MTFQVILLALASTIRLTSLAAVYTLLSSPSPRRLMTAYDTAGLIFTIAFGALVVWAVHGIAVSSGADRAKGIADITGGVVVLGFAALVLTGRVSGPEPPTRRAPPATGSNSSTSTAPSGPPRSPARPPTSPASSTSSPST